MAKIRIPIMMMKNESVLNICFNLILLTILFQKDISFYSYVNDFFVFKRVQLFGIDIIKMIDEIVTRIFKLASKLSRVRLGFTVMFRLTSIVMFGVDDDISNGLHVFTTIETH
jgi:hypothetical protein